MKMICILQAVLYPSFLQPHICDKKLHIFMLTSMPQLCCGLDQYEECSFISDSKKKLTFFISACISYEPLVPL